MVRDQCNPAEVTSEEQAGHLRVQLPRIGGQNAAKVRFDGLRQDDKSLIINKRLVSREMFHVEHSL
jgi:hypothetical protein